MIEGVVESTEPRGLFRVRTDDGRTLLATIGTDAKRVIVNVLRGDRVTIEVSPLDPTRGRITGKTS